MTSAVPGWPAGGVRGGGAQREGAGGKCPPSPPPDSDRRGAFEAAVLQVSQMFPPPQLSDSQNRLRQDSLNFANSEPPLSACTWTGPGYLGRSLPGLGRTPEVDCSRPSAASPCGRRRCQRPSLWRAEREPPPPRAWRTLSRRGREQQRGELVSATSRQKRPAPGWAAGPRPASVGCGPAPLREGLRL